MPGPDTAYILQGPISCQGREAAIASALGICAGSIVHTCAAALGLSAILASSAAAFGFLKPTGGAYLIFLGSGKMNRLAAQSLHLIDRCIFGDARTLQCFAKVL